MRRSLLLLNLLLASCAHAEVRTLEEAKSVCAPHLNPFPTLEYRTAGKRLTLRVLADRLVHVDFGTRDSKGELVFTPFVDPKVALRGPKAFARDGEGFVTEELRVSVAVDSLCVSFFDRASGERLSRICPRNMNGEWKKLEIERDGVTDLYGLGEQFLESRIADPNGNWMGEVRHPGNDEGNARPKFNGGGIGNAQFPILYALGAGRRNYALYLDQVQRQVWDFKSDTFKVSAVGDQLRLFFMGGPDLPALHRGFMDLVGHPLVPPKAAFGLWMSKYGYRSWTEIREVLASLRADGFPLDGFALDIFWFGGVTAKSRLSNMGTLKWDSKNFPNPAATIADLRDKHGVGVMTIEEPFVAKALSEHRVMEAQGYLATDPTKINEAFTITENPQWWGIGGLIDFTDDHAGRFWHDQKRAPLVKQGVIGFWTDLGEPEQSHDQERWSVRPEYHGIAGTGTGQAAIQNAYSFKWHQSIGDAMSATTSLRPWVLSRSAGPGSQRFGATMWSGDTASNFGTLRAQLAVQSDLALSGMYYFGADIGGHYREKGLAAEPGTDLGDLYTKWFAIGSLIDFPVRPHTKDLDPANPNPTAPNKIGDVRSNLANIRARYELAPYYYSLAHRAHLYAEPLVGPLVYHYQADPAVRKINDTKMIGRDLLVRLEARAGHEPVDVYLPSGGWYDYYTNALHTSGGQVLGGVPQVRGGLLRPPMFVRAGALIPRAFVDDRTWNVLGQRAGGGRRSDLIVRAYAGLDGQRTEFTLYEDDGTTTGYTRGAVATTLLAQERHGRQVRVTIEPTIGEYPGQDLVRPYRVEFVGPEFGPGWTATLNGRPLTARAGAGLLSVRIPKADIRALKEIVLTGP